VADINDIVAAATKLGGIIGTHPAVGSYRELTRQLDLDISAQKLLGQFEQLVQLLQMKEQQGQPIEVQEKRDFESLQNSIQMHPLIKKLAAAEGEYRAVMTKVQESINTGLTAQLTGQALPETAAPASKIILDT
jgi:cell fate (sporulation/competence/biofilm development) regulator YlbF (YheA/YmcA/DUF963 family)